MFSLAPKQSRDRSAPGHPAEMQAITARIGKALAGVGVFSAAINILALTGSIYMLQLYDRVLPSHSVATLAGLTMVMLLLYAGFGVFDFIRARMLTRIGLKIERALRSKVIGAVMLMPLGARSPGDGMQPVRDLDQVRGFMSGAGPTALFDLPWLPFYLGLVFIMHPWLGLLGLAGAGVLIALTILTEIRSRAPARAAATSSGARNSLGEGIRRNAEVVQALGMGTRMTERWSRRTEAFLSHQIRGTDVVNGYGSVTKVLRMVLQSLVLALGAYLVILGEASPGVMIAASILVSRALAPVETAIANWRGFIAARLSWDRLGQVLAAVPDQSRAITLPPPRQSLRVEGVWVAAPGQTTPILRNISFEAMAGDGVGIIGPAAAGKSSLARTLVGAWAAERGSVRLDGAAISQWQKDDLGRHIGYLPQDIELFAGTVAENICRFDPDATSAAVIAAAEEAGVHQMILDLPHDYETQIGEAGAALSGGQRQRIGLARALYGKPFLVVLDEPNSNLDSAGEVALTTAIAAVRARKGIVVVVAHRASAINALNRLMVLANGQVQTYGPKEDVMRKAVQSASAHGHGAASHLKVIGEPTKMDDA